MIWLFLVKRITAPVNRLNTPLPSDSIRETALNKRQVPRNVTTRFCYMRSYWFIIENAIRIPVGIFYEERLVIYTGMHLLE
jgi:hypothetical protein